MLFNDYVYKLCTNEAKKDGRLGDYMKKVTKVYRTPPNYRCDVISTLQYPVTEDELFFLDLHKEDYNIDKMRVCNKVSRGGVKYDSHAEKRIKKRNTHVVQLEPNSMGVEVVDVLFYIVDKEEEMVYAACDTARIVGPCVPLMCDHIREIEMRYEYVNLHFFLLIIIL